MPINIQETCKLITLDQKRKSSSHIIIKTLSLQDKERLLKAAREKGQLTHKGSTIIITPDFSTEPLKDVKA